MNDRIENPNTNGNPAGDGNPIDDPFDLKALREPQKLIQVRQRRLSIPVKRKPNRHDFVRTHPDPEYRINMPLFSLKADGSDEEMYFVHPSVTGELDGEYRLHTIFVAVTLQGGVFLWCVPLPLEDGREENSWLTTNRAAAEQAAHKWLRVASDRKAGAYEVYEYQGAPVEPQWPEETPLELYKLGFKNRIVDKPDHPLILRLRGIG